MAEADPGPGGNGSTQARTIQVGISGTSSTESYTLAPGLAQYVQSAYVEIDNTAGGDARPTLTVSEQSGVVIAKKRQGEAIPAGDTGSASWALRLTDEGGNAYVRLASVELSANTKYLNTGPIPQTCTHLHIEALLRETSSNRGLNVNFNTAPIADTTYGWITRYSDDSGNTFDDDGYGSNNAGNLFYIAGAANPGENLPADAWTQLVMDIPYYRVARFKTAFLQFGGQSFGDNTGTPLDWTRGMVFRGLTDPITAVLFWATGNMLAGSRVSVYGIR